MPTMELEALHEDGIRTFVVGDSELCPAGSQAGQPTLQPRLELGQL